MHDARRLAGDRPLRYKAADTVPSGCSGFDVAFSHEVLHLVTDLPTHARAIHAALAPGGIYYAVTGVHAESRPMREWHAANVEALQLPPLLRVH